STAFCMENICPPELKRNKEEFLLKSNGVVKEGLGKAVWFMEGQLFRKDKFYLAKIGQEFSFIFFTNKYVFVEHVYRVRDYNGVYVILEWVRQISSFENRRVLRKQPKFVEEPRGGYVDNSITDPDLVLTEETGKNSIFAGEITPGGGVIVGFKK